MKKILMILLLTFSYFACGSDKKADTLNSFLSSCIDIMEESNTDKSKLERAAVFCLSPKRFFSDDYTRKMVLKRFNEDDFRLKFISSLKKHIKEMPIEYKKNEHARYQLDGNNTSRLEFLDGRWYIAK